MQKPQRRTRQRGVLKGKNTGGGGDRRAAFSTVFRELGIGGKMDPKVQSSMFKRAHQQVNSASPEQLEDWARKGEAGTASHAAGSRAFGPRVQRSKRRRVGLLEDYISSCTAPAISAGATVPTDVLVSRSSCASQPSNYRL